MAMGTLVVPTVNLPMNAGIAGISAPAATPTAIAEEDPQRQVAVEEAQLLRDGLGHGFSPPSGSTVIEILACQRVSDNA